MQGRTQPDPLSPDPTWEAFEARRRRIDQQIESDTPRSMAPRDPAAPVPLSVLDDAPYVELHLHSNYSLLEGASSIDELVKQAGAQEHRALALTDHEGMYGAMEFARAAKEAGLRPITGLELTLAEADGTRHHVTLLAESREGYANLCRVSSIAFGLFEEEQASRETRRLDPVAPVEALAVHAEGLIVLTGCREGLVPRLVQEHQLVEAEAALQRWVTWFGAANVFVELQDNLVFGDRPRNRALVTLAERLGIGVVGTGNVHYHKPDRHRLQDVLVAIRHRKTLDTSHRERRPNGEFYLRPPQEQAQRFAAYHPEAAANSVRIARRCTFDLTQDLGYRLPQPETASGRASQEELTALCRARLYERYATAPPAERTAAEERLEEELRLITKNNLAGFFLVYHEIFQLAEEVAEEVRGISMARRLAHLPPGRGRGSSVASIVCYLVGLSHIDPIRARLPIDRFLNEELHTLPDIDLDFARDIRERLIERVHQTYHRDHAALVAIFPTYRIRSAVRDIGKALGLPEAELGRVAKRAHPYHNATELAEELECYAGTAHRVEARGWRELVDLSSQLAGFPRHLSQHVGGIVISSEPLVDCVPVQPAAWPDRYVCHWDKDSVDDARMVKIDFLGLGMLSVVEETVDLIAEQGHAVPDLSRIPLDDPDVYDDICRGDTVGVFQIESRAQIAMLPRTQPRTLDDLTVQVSIVRPGPIVGGAVNPYVREREKQRALGEAYRVPSVHPCVDEVLRGTLGVVLFQEQVVQVARKMGGFTPGLAEQFRRAMSRRRSTELMESYRQQFMDGAAAQGVSQTTAERMFQNLLGFAEFGFPMSHGAAFGLLAYQTSWLKRYYPAPFSCALFNSQPMGFYPPHVLVNDAKRHDIEIRRPDINLGRACCTVEEPEEGRGAVRIGIGYTTAIGEAGATRIDEERVRSGEYRSLFDFVQRTGLSQAATTNLIRIGAFDGFGLNRRELIWQLGLFAGGLATVGSTAQRWARAKLRKAQDRQIRLPLPTTQDEVALADFTAYQRMAADYSVLRLSPDSHPMQFLRPPLGEGVVSSRHLRSMPAGAQVDLAGLVVCRQQPLTAKGIVFLLLEDEWGMVNVMVSRNVVERHREAVRTAAFVRVRGVLEARAGEQRTLVAKSVTEFLPAEVLAMPEGKSWG